MKIWTIDEEASALRARFEGVNRAAFARDHQVKGGQAMIYQHITGRRPINVEAAMAYAEGFGCSLAEISPRLALEAQKAAALASETVAAETPAPMPWPFPEIPEDQVRALPSAQLSALQGAMALAIAQLKLGISMSPANPPPQRAKVVDLRAHKPGGLVDMDHADDPFPMRMTGLPPAPWEGGTTTFGAERNLKFNLSTQPGVVANAGPGEPHSANDEFEEVPELAEVRLAAGDGIENHSEDQTGMMQFRRSFLRAVGADNGKARVVYAKGDSMEPVIRDGAALLVVPNENLTLQDVASGGVYAINFDGKMLVKTVTRDRMTGRWVARSFNPTYSDVALENGSPVRVLGQIVWAGSRLRDDEAGQWTRI
ncbi:helix-turn-helix transcriptional regulator [Achromobacter xylosoxidans]|uniref:Repressor n=1 Tax=Alcaligenes xylosoxydans xylosoxydans TaxID=85698 RepID=A0A1R1JUF1_ALCXX|nr:S24 family peptidase [Achromobacter xylosoxidans]OMG87990.1 repressor [Achromobacter xylosoxidans]